MLPAAFRAWYGLSPVSVWGRLWRKDVGYSRMPLALEQALDTIDPSFKGLVYDAIAGGMNQAEIEGQLWGGITRRSLDAFIPDVAAKMGMSETDAAELIRHSGAHDFLRERLDNAQNDRDVVRAFRDLEDFRGSVACYKVTH